MWAGRGPGGARAGPWLGGRRRRGAAPEKCYWRAPGRAPLKIWIDILTPKQVVFFEPMVRRLRGRGHRVVCTSRSYREASELARVRGLSTVQVGRHGGGTRAGKLAAGVRRVGGLVPVVSDLDPDLAVSFCSPDAAFVARGLGIDHIAFIDAPHSHKVLRLAAPLVQRLLVPWIVTKESIARHGIPRARVVQYRSIDGAITARRRPAGARVRLPVDPSKRTILVRPTETQASYTDGSNVADGVIGALAGAFPSENILVLSRYAEQTRRVRSMFGRAVTVINMSYDGRHLLDNCDVFVGSGGTMTAEAALSGVPTVSYNGVPNVVEEYLVRRRLAARETTGAGIRRRVGRILASGASARRAAASRASREAAAMEDPYDCLARAAASMGRPP